jgi:hypothetical protein
MDVHTLGLDQLDSFKTRLSVPCILAMCFWNSEEKGELAASFGLDKANFVSKLMLLLRNAHVHNPLVVSFDSLNGATSSRQSKIASRRRRSRSSRILVRSCGSPQRTARTGTIGCGITRRNLVILIREIRTIIRVFVAASRAGICEVSRYLWLLWEEIVGDTFGRDFGIHASRAAFLAFKNPTPSAHASTLPCARQNLKYRTNLI